MNLVNTKNSQDILELIFGLYSNLLGDIDNRKYRDLFVSTQLFKKNIERCLNTDIKIKQKTNSLNLIFNCIRNGNLDKWCFDLIKVYYVNYPLIKDSNEILKMLIGISKISELDDSRYVKELIEYKIHILIMHHNDIEWNPSLAESALRALGNISSYTDTINMEEPSVTIVISFYKFSLKELLDQGLITFLEFFINNYKEDYNKFAQTLLWLIANISTENTIVIPQTIVKSNLIFDFIILHTKSNSHYIKKEAIWALVNLITGSDFDLASIIVRKEGMECLIQEISSSEEPELLLLTLEGIKNLLKLGDDFSELENQLNPFSYQFEKLKGEVALENLIKHPHKDVYNATRELLNKYFGDMYMQEDNIY